MPEKVASIDTAVYVSCGRLSQHSSLFFPVTPFFHFYIPFFFSLSVWSGVVASVNAASFTHTRSLLTHTRSLLTHTTCTVCGLEWSPQSTQLASGGNDNVLNLWEPRTNTARLTIERHCAAVSA